MKKALFIVYQFPPKTGPGVFRSLHFVKNIREFGYEPIVCTITEESIIEQYGKSESGLITQIPKDIKIFRIEHSPISRLRDKLMKMRIYRFVWYFCYFRFLDDASPWTRKAYAPILEIIKNENIELIYTSSGPFSVWNLAYKLKIKSGVKWVADIRDPFTDGYMWLFPSKLHWHLTRKWEKRMLRAADKVVVNTPEVKNLYTKRKLVEEDKLIAITNGY